jgi:hypothetical protein
MLCITVSCPARANVFEIFAKGSASKNYITDDEWQVSVSLSTGLAIILIPQLRIEGRYSNVSSLQNRLTETTSDGVTFTISDMKTTTTIYSVGLDLDIVSDKYSVQPFIYAGMGYIDTARSFYLQSSSLPEAVAFKEVPRKYGFSANLGGGLRVRIARTLSLELEAFAYGIDLKRPNPIVNWMGTAGIRIFI